MGPTRQRSPQATRPSIMGGATCAYPNLEILWNNGSNWTYFSGDGYTGVFYLQGVEVLGTGNQDGRIKCYGTNSPYALLALEKPTSILVPS